MLDKRDMENVNRIHTDFRSDVIAAGLAEHGFDMDKIFVLRRQGDFRDMGKEIKTVDYKQDYEEGGGHILSIKTNLRGIYDKLPEGLFHSSETGKAKSKESVIEGMRKQQEEEFFVRRFFSLFETEVERTRIDIQLIEMRYDRPERHRSLVDTMLPFWPVIKQMDLRTAVLFIRTIPYITKIRDSFGNIAEALSIIMGYDIRIELENRAKKPEVEYPKLNEVRLGVNSVLKGVMYDTDPDAVVYVEPAGHDIKDMLPGGGKRMIAEALMDIFMPADTDYEIVVRTVPENHTCRMGDRNTPCYLGINAKLRSNVNES